LSHSEVKCARDLNGVHFKTFLWRRSGRIASLYAFVSFFKLSEEFNSFKHPRKRHVSRSSVKTGLLRVLLKWSNTELSKTSKLASFAKIVSIAYGLPLETILSYRYSDFRIENSTIHILINGRWLALESEISERFYLSLNAEASPQDYVFVGRSPGDCLSSSAVYYRLKRLCALRGYEFDGHSIKVGTSRLDSD